MRIFCSYIHIANRVEIRSIENIDIPFGNELVSFHACLERKKKKIVQKLEHPCLVENSPSDFIPATLFLYLFIHYSGKVRIEISIEKEKFFTHITRVSLNFIFLIFPRIFSFYTSRSCARSRV